MNLGTSIKELRKNQHLSQSDLAEKAGMTQATLSKIENGVRPNDESLDAISRALNVPVALLMAMGMEKDEVAPEQQTLYDELFPVIKDMIFRLSGMQKPQ